MRMIKSLLLGIALSLGLAGAAQAQSSSGNIVGSALAGDKIVVNGPDTGFHHELEIEEDGKFSIRRVPTGTYNVVKIKADGTVDSSQTLVVRVGSTARGM